MTRNNQNRAQQSSNFSDATIRRFLLGQLRGGEQSIFETQLLTSDELAERVRLHELAVADDYARGLLTRADEDRIQRRFLLTQDRHRLVAASRALSECFAPTPVFKPIARRKAGFNLERPVWRYAFAAVILLIVFAAVWLRVKEPQLVERIVSKRWSPKSKPTAAPTVTHHSTSSSVPAHPEDSAPLPEHQTMLLIPLDAKNTVDNPLDLKLSDSGVTLVRVVVSLEKDEDATYRAELWNSSGESLLNVDTITSDDGKLSFEIPARLLSKGEYLIRLSPTEALAIREPQNYYFRVSR